MSIGAEKVSAVTITWRRKLNQVITFADIPPSWPTARARDLCRKPAKSHPFLRLDFDVVVGGDFDNAHSLQRPEHTGQVKGQGTRSSV